MDSLTHIVLGAAVGTAVLGRKVGPRAALWGGICATLPDLDVLVPYGDPVRDFTYHRAGTHAISWLTLASPALAWLVARIERRRSATFREWLSLVWLALLSHPLLDAFTVYGTQLLLPFSDYPVGVGSIFIVDPLFTLPLLVGLTGALALRSRDPGRASHWNASGLALSVLYLGWTVAAQSHVEGVVRRAVAATQFSEGQALVTPTPLNSLLWRVVIMDEDGYAEGYHSLLRDEPLLAVERHASDRSLLESLQGDWSVQRLAWFAKGFYSVREVPAGVPVATGSTNTIRQLLGLVETAAATAGRSAPAERRSAVVMTDLRMGQTPWFVFSFVVAERVGDRTIPVPNRQLPMRRVPSDALVELWRLATGSG